MSFHCVKVFWKTRPSFVMLMDLSVWGARCVRTYMPTIRTITTVKVHSPMRMPYAAQATTNVPAMRYQREPRTWCGSVGACHDRSTSELGLGVFCGIDVCVR